MSTVEILTQMGFGKPDKMEVFKRAEDNSDYNVWKVEVDNTVYVLKKTNDLEISVYETFLKQAEYGAPHFYKRLNYLDESYILFNILGEMTCELVIENR